MARSHIVEGYQNYANESFEKRKRDSSLKDNDAEVKHKQIETK